MRSTITRKLGTTTIKAVTFDIVDGEPKVNQLPDLTVAGNIDELKAYKVAQKHFKNNSIKITDISTDFGVYEISIDDFLKHATKVETQTDTKQGEPETN